MIAWKCLEERGACLREESMWRQWTHYAEYQSKSCNCAATKDMQEITRVGIQYMLEILPCQGYRGSFMRITDWCAEVGESWKTQGPKAVLFPYALPLLKHLS